MRKALSTTTTSLTFDDDIPTPRGGLLMSAADLLRPQSTFCDPAPLPTRRLRTGLDSTPNAPTSTTSLTVPGCGRSLRVKIASSRDEFEQAFQLLAAKYQSRGYEEPSTKLFRFTPYHVLPDTMTFVAKHGERVVATMSLVPDTALLGLPMECIYGSEVEALRRRGLRLGEVTSLADHDLSTREFLQAFLGMKRLMFQYHLQQGGDTWVITVNPRHRNYYCRVLGFEPMGPRRSYPTVRNHPAEAFLVSVDLMRANAPLMHRRIFDETLPETVLARPARQADHVRHFADQSTQAHRRTILDIHQFVENLGSPPRWREFEVSRQIGPSVKLGS